MYVIELVKMHAAKEVLFKSLARPAQLVTAIVYVTINKVKIKDNAKWQQKAKNIIDR